jgi:hypothetical protein
MVMISTSFSSSKDNDVVRAAMAHMNQDPATDLSLYDENRELIWSALE